MNVINRGIGIDNGGSGMRYGSYPIIGTYEKVDQPFVILPSNFVKVTEKPFRIKDGVNEFEIMNVTRGNDVFEGLIAVGETALAYTGESVRVSNMKAKTMNHEYYVQILVAIAQDAIKALHHWLPDYQRKFGNNTVAPDIDYAVVTCIPAREHSGAVNYSEKLKEQLKGSYCVEFPAMQKGCNKVTFHIQAKNIEVAPEGGIVVTMLGRDKLMKKQITAIDDIGHNTHDISFFVGPKMIAGNVHTSNEAGKALLTSLKDTLADNGFRVSDNKIEEVLVTGRVKRGSENADVKELVDNVKRQYLKNKILPELMTAIQKSGYVPEEIDNFVPVGAVLSDKKLTAELMAMAQIKNAELLETGCDSRLLNVMCAFKRAKHLVGRMEGEAASRFLRE